MEIIIKKNLSYASPIDGKPITTWAKRQYDLESNGCVDSREGYEMARDARKHWKTGIEDLTLDEVEASIKYPK